MAGSKKTATRKAAPLKTSPKTSKAPKASRKRSVQEDVSFVSKSAANAIDEQLARYRSMRDFNLTEEPSGAHTNSASAQGLPFCVQKHAASHLHL